MGTSTRARRYRDIDELNRPWHDLDDDWMDEGKCSGLTVEEAAIFFVDRDRSVRARMQVLKAKTEFCGVCPVQAKCLAYAIQGEMRGVWGGTTGEERRRMGPTADRRRKQSA